MCALMPYQVFCPIALTGVVGLGCKPVTHLNHQWLLVSVKNKVKRNTLCPQLFVNIKSNSHATFVNLLFVINNVSTSRRTKVPIPSKSFQRESFITYHTHSYVKRVVRNKVLKTSISYLSAMIVGERSWIALHSILYGSKDFTNCRFSQSVFPPCFLQFSLPTILKEASSKGLLDEFTGFSLGMCQHDIACTGSSFQFKYFWESYLLRPR